MPQSQSPSACPSTGWWRRSSARSRRTTTRYDIGSGVTVFRIYRDRKLTRGYCSDEMVAAGRAAVRVRRGRSGAAVDGPQVQLQSAGSAAAGQVDRNAGIL